ncbi:MAG: phage tail assembly chaperone [Pseudomonadota bacterium]
MLPWAKMFRASLAAGLSAEAFWRLSVREWRWLAGDGGEETLTANALAELMSRYPDQKVDEEFQNG